MNWIRVSNGSNDDIFRAYTLQDCVCFSGSLQEKYWGQESDEQVRTM